MQAAIQALEKHLSDMFQTQTAAVETPQTKLAYTERESEV